MHHEWLPARAVGLGIGTVTTVGIERWREGDFAARVEPTSVAGFPCRHRRSDSVHDYCSVEVDVAPGQLLDVQFSDGGGSAASPQDELCRRADTARPTESVKTLLRPAEFTLQTLLRDRPCIDPVPTSLSDQLHERRRGNSWSERQQDVLRLQPHMIPALRAEFGTALDQLKEALVGLSRVAISRRHGSATRSSARGSCSLHRPRNGRSELFLSSARRLSRRTGRVHDTLQRMEDEYRRSRGRQRRPADCGAGHERRPLGGALARGDLLARAAGARAGRLRRRRGRVEHRREHDPRRRRPAHPRRQADRRRLAGLAPPTPCTAG